MNRFIFLPISLWCFTCAAPLMASPAAPTSQPASGSGFSFLFSRGKIAQTQVALEADGTLILVWVEKGAAGTALFAAHRKTGKSFSEPVMINETGKPLSKYTGDEARPSIAVGPGGRVAVAWVDQKDDILAALGSAHGAAWNQPFLLNRDGGRALQTMPRLAITPDGVVHAIWLDARIAPEGMDEPADLYYARVADGKVTEQNLTARQDSSVCGCCRPFMEAKADGGLEIAFRNTSEGYRDIYFIHGESDGRMSDPIPSSPPVWKIEGCPVAGPILVEGRAIWKDGSASRWRLLASHGPDKPPEVVVDAGEEGSLPLSPRRLRIPGGLSELFLVSRDGGTSIHRLEAGQWKSVEKGLPRWVTGAALANGKLVLVGTGKGKFMSMEKRVTWD